MADRLEIEVLRKANSVEEDKIVDKHLLDLVRPNCCYEMKKIKKNS
jgi:hypothetical protein